MEPQTRPVGELADGGPLEIDNAERRMTRVAVLRVVEAGEVLIGRQPAQPALLRMVVDLARVGSFANDVDRGSSVGRPTDDGERAPDVQAGLVCPLEVLRCGPARTAEERLDHPAAELVAVGVVEPPDLLALRIDRALQ